MEKIFEFISNHPVLASGWLVTLAVLLWTEQRKSGRSVSPAEATRLINKESAALLDIRTKKEWDTGYIANSRHIPFAELDKRIIELEKLKDKPVIIVCNLGQTAGSAGKTLKANGFTEVMRLAGGITEWKAQHLPIVKK
ncbi:rhodanese-like domain-containing protein [Nitrincola iocasae]|jgi:rhodanese-related sulfurtransferase|uniref:Rhodanese-like domain-containing protein n=1 Tax=Nitrincola iocasae TaxID=2614693 RepID=A0A5J6LHU5_9GAMM|nr:rhodanese-like domain-containing protein [Nitrincola iocasae]QEW08207.1 rhodanese-like domain-containing protein [Nitrincola iocasae]